MKNNTIKLQAFMAHAGIASRRASEKLIEAKKIKVNGEIAHIGQRINPDKDEVEYLGETIGGSENHRYFLVDKPLGYVSTTSDEKGRKTVVSLLPELEERLYPVGRLDVDSEGLILLTNDGKLAQKLTHPSFRIEKTYNVLVGKKPSFKALSHLRSGVKLKDGFTKRCRVDILSKEEDGVWIEITITEGRNRQVRRMFDRIGYPVEKLVRTKMGPLSLDILDGERVIELKTDDIEILKSL